MEQNEFESDMAARLKEKNRAALEYYHANKGKINKILKEKEISSKEKVCKTKGLPDYLGKHITFRKDQKIQLLFTSEEELRKFLFNIKFKSNFTEEIFKGEKRL